MADWLLGLALESVSADGGSIQLLSADGEELFLVAARGLSERLIKHGRHRLGTGVSGTVAASRTPALLHGTKPGRLARERATVQASISVPLEDAGALVGVLNVSVSARGRQFGPQHLSAMEQLGPRFAHLLADAGRTEGQAPELDLPRWTRLVPAADLRTRMWTLAEHVRAAFVARRAAFFFTTEAGDWLPIADAAASGEPPTPGRIDQDLLSRALLEETWLLARDPNAAVPETDPVVLAVDRAFASDRPDTTCVYAPLVGLEPLGALVLEYTSLDEADRCMRHGADALQQLSLYCDAQTRAYRGARRKRKLADLARTHPRLASQFGSGEFDAAVAAEAARLVDAHSAIVRRVDESTRMFSRPAAHGLPVPLPDRWRELDARVTEHTLEERRAVLTAGTTVGPPGEDRWARCSRISVPVTQDEHLVAIVNVYDKEWSDALDPGAFTALDRELLESFAVLVAPLLGAPAMIGAPHEAAAGGARAAPPPPPSAPAPFDAMRVRRDTPADADPHAARQDAAALIEVALAASALVGVWICRFPGLAALGDEAAPARERLALAVRAGLRPIDRVAWWGAEDLVIVTPGADIDAAPLETRLLRLVRPQLARVVAQAPEPIEIWIGAANAPRDGNSAALLLETAARRVR
jgi:GAF domain-containing protein